MKIELEMPMGLEEQLKSVVILATQEAMQTSMKRLSAKEWMSLQEACEYIGVCNNTFNKLRQMGLKVCVIDGTKRVSKVEIDKFLYKNSY